MRGFADLTGKQIGLLYVVKYDGKKGKRRFWVCKCKCGNIKSVCSSHLMSDKNTNATSCRCVKIEKKAKRIPRSKIEQKVALILKTIKTRCYNPNRENRKYYYDKNITVCDEWMDKKNGVDNFIKWALNNGYNEEKLPNGRNKWTIERKDNNGNYEPTNCRWATDIEQARNKSTNHKVIYNNESYVLPELLHLSKVGIRQLYQRVSKGWDIEKALFTPAYKYKRLVAKE